MFVWDGNEKPKKPSQSIVIQINDDGSCIAILEEDLDAFHKGYAFTTESWDHYEEIPEKTKRLMTHDEIFAMIQRELRKGNLVLFENPSGTTTVNWHSSNNPEMHPYSTDLGKTWHKLEVEE